MTVNQLVHLDPVPARADIVLAIDTTQTMQPAIDQPRPRREPRQPGQGEHPRGALRARRLPRLPVRDTRAGAPYPYRLLTGLTADPLAVQNAIGQLATGTGGSPNQPPDPPGAGPEAYNRVLFEAVNDPALASDPAAQRFLVVLGDDVPREVAPAPGQPDPFPACAKSAVTDPGRDGVAGTADDLHTKAVVDGLVAAHTTLLMINYQGTGAASFACYQQLAAATGGTAAVGGAGVSITNTIVTGVTAAGAGIDRVDLVTEPATCPVPVTFSPAPPYGPLSAPADLNLSATLTVPNAPGTTTCRVSVRADNVERTAALLQITVPGAATDPSARGSRTVAV